MSTSRNLEKQKNQNQEQKNQNQEADKNADARIERAQKRINFWVKDISVFIFLLLIVLLIDIYAFIVLIKPNTSEIKVRFALVILSCTITSFLSYLLGKSSR